MSDQVVDNIIQGTMNAIAKDVNTVMDATQISPFEMRGKKTCLVKQSFQQMLVNCKYIKFNKRIEARLTRIEKKLEEISSKSVMTEEDFDDSKKMINEEEAKQREKLENVQRELIDQKNSYNASSTAETSLKEDVRKLNHIQKNEEQIRQSYNDELQELEDLIRANQARHMDLTEGETFDNYKSKMSDAIRNKDVGEILQTAMNQGRQIEMSENSIQEQIKYRNALEENRDHLPQTKRNLKLQTSIPYIIAKGMLHVATAIPSDIIEILKQKAENDAYIHSHRKDIESELEQTEDLIRTQQECLEDFKRGTQRQTYNQQLRDAISHGTKEDIHKIENSYRNQLLTIQTSLKNLEICRKTLQMYLKKLSKNKRLLKLQFSEPYMQAKDVTTMREPQVPIDEKEEPMSAISPNDDIHMLLNQALKNCAGDEMGMKQLHGLIFSIANMGVEKPVKQNKI